MKIIRPFVVNDAALFSSNVSESEHTLYSSGTVYSTGTYVRVVSTDIHKIYQSLTGTTSVCTMTIAAPCVVTKVAHGLTEGMPISFTTTGALPTGIVSGTVYYVKTPLTDTFNIAATVGGAAITSSGSQSGTHTYIASSNYNIAVTDTTKWLDCGATNRWKLFDSSITSQTSNTTSIVNVFTTTGRIDSVALLNISAASVTITQTDATDGVVYNQTYNVISDSGIVSWFSYFFEPIIRKTDLVVTDLLPYANSTISVTLTDTGNTVLCGGMVLGLSTDISYLAGNDTRVGSELGMKFGFTDYSTKQQDVFGNYTILERAFRKNASFTIYVDATYVDTLTALLASIRATPIVYLGSGSYTSSAIYGFFKDFSIDVAYHTKSICTISLEGLT